MTKFVVIILLQVVFVLRGIGQSRDVSPVYLTGYTFSKGVSEIGFVKARASNGVQIQAITLEGKSSKWFKLSSDYRLLAKKKLKPRMQWADVILNVKTTAGDIRDTFRIVHDAFIRNKVIAHRGAWKNTGATENSVAALQHAIAIGCEGSEFDVHMSSDSIPFIHHDPGVNGVSIAKSGFSALRSIKLSNGEVLPTLEEYLTAGIAQNNTKLILEIKTSELGKQGSIALTNKVVQLVEKLHAQGWVDYIAFDYDVCKEVMRIAPYAKVSYLNGDKAPLELVQNHFYGLDYHYNVFTKNPGWIKEAQQNKLTVNVWTVNDKAMMEDLLQQHVDFITTNEPELLLSIIRGK